MRDDDVWLDELLAAAAPVMDHDLDRPEVRNASRALTEELSMFVPTTTRPLADDESPSAARAGARAEASTEPAVGTHVPLTRPSTTRARRGRRTLVATVAAVVLGLGSALYTARGNGPDAPVEEVGVAASTPTGGAPGPAGRPAAQPTTACEWTAAWFAADDAGEPDARNQAVAGIAELAALAHTAGDEVTAVRIEATMSPMSAGHRVAVEEASAALGC